MIVDQQNRTLEYWRYDSPYDLMLFLPAGYDVLAKQEQIERFKNVLDVEVMWQHRLLLLGVDTHITAIPESTANYEMELLQGMPPVQDDEIVLPVNLASRGSVQVGDTVLLYSAADGSIPEEYRVCGIMSNRLGTLCGAVGTIDAVTRMNRGNQLNRAFGYSLGIKADFSANLEYLIAEINELQKNDPRWLLQKYSGEHVYHSEAGTVALVTTTIRILLLLASSFFIYSFTTFSRKEFVKEDGVLFAIGLDKHWLFLVYILNFFIVSSVAFVSLYFSLPLLQTLFGINFWSFKLDFSTFCLDMLPIIVLSLVVAAVHSLSFMEEHEAVVWLRDDWLD